MKVAYPVIFTDIGDNILIEVPDLKILTQANSQGEQKASLADAIGMARDAIGLNCVCLKDEGIPIETPSSISDIDIRSGTFFGEGVSILSVVDVDTNVYRFLLDSQSAVTL